MNGADDEPQRFIPDGFQGDFKVLLQQHDWTTVPNATIDYVAGWMELMLRGAKRGDQTGDINVVIPD